MNSYLQAEGSGKTMFDLTESYQKRVFVITPEQVSGFYFIEGRGSVPQVRVIVLVVELIQNERYLRHRVIDCLKPK